MSKFKLDADLTEKELEQLPTVELTTESNDVITETEQPIQLTRYMVGSFKNPVNSEWMLGYVKFDPVTGALGEFKSERVAGDFEEMRYKVKIKLVELGVLQPDPVLENK